MRMNEVVKMNLYCRSIAILVEGNSEIGLGHVSRCITLGKEFRLRGWSVFFVSNHSEGISKVEENGFDIFSYSKNSEDEKIKEVINIFNNKKVSLVIIDSYIITIDFFNNFRKSFNGKIAYIDDLNNFLSPVDILIHGSILGQIYQYKMNYKNTLILNGLQYNLLRDEFKDLPPKQVKDNVKEVLLTAGGADFKNMTTKVINIFVESRLLETFQLNVVIGSAFENIDEIYELSKKNNNIKIYYNPISIAEIMIRSDIAITAGGSTVYELFATGTPSVAMITSNNQKIFIEELEKEDLLVNGGMLEDLDANILSEKLSCFINERDNRMKMSRITQQLLDGYGATRVVQDISAFLGTEETENAPATNL